MLSAAAGNLYSRETYYRIRLNVIFGCGLNVFHEIFIQPLRFKIIVIGGWTWVVNKFFQPFHIWNLQNLKLLIKFFSISLNSSFV